MSKKQKLVIIMSIVSAFVVGLLFGFLLGKNPTGRKPKKELYQSSCSFYVNTATETNFDSLSSSDLAASSWVINGIVELFDSFSDEIATEIAFEFPGVEYSMSLEKLEHTPICKVLVTGEDPYQIAGICDLATELFLEKVHSVVTGFSCQVIDRAKIPTTPIE
jgi:capsular polysaccharide biosynthesis protein